MPIYVGQTQVKRIFFGTQEVGKVFFNATTVVFERAPKQIYIRQVQLAQNAPTFFNGGTCNNIVAYSGRINVHVFIPRIIFEYNIGSPVFVSIWSNEGTSYAGGYIYLDEGDSGLYSIFGWFSVPSWSYNSIDYIRVSDAEGTWNRLITIHGDRYIACGTYPGAMLELQFL